MKMHIKSIHNSSRPKVTKRLPNFTPISKPAKKAKNVSPITSNTFLNAEGIADESILMLDDTFGGKGNTSTLDENIGNTIPGDTSKEPEYVEETEVLTCGKCEFDAETEGSLRDHINNMHTQITTYCGMFSHRNGSNMNACGQVQ